MKKYYSGLGWHLSIPTHQKYFEEIAYSLADKGYTLRTTVDNSGCKAFINGVERFCSNRKVEIEDYLEVYLPTNKYNGSIADQPGYFNIQQFDNIDDALKLTLKYGKKALVDLQSELSKTLTAPYICLGKNLKIPCQFIIIDMKLYELSTDGIIEDAHGYSGQIVRTVNSLKLNTTIFNYEYKEHKKRINKLIYTTKS